MKNKKAIFWGSLTILWLCVIYSFSLEPADLSEDTSLGLIDWLTTYIVPWLKDEVALLSEGQMRFLHGTVRKIAHFTEYFILGTLAMAAALQVDAKVLVRCVQFGRRCVAPRFIQGLSTLIFCVIAASVDETIQLFVEGRAGRIQDVVLDSFGAAAGLTFLFAAVMFWNNTSKKV